MPESNPLAALEYEIAAEKAASLGRAGKALEAALEALHAFDRARPVRWQKARELLVVEAAERLWYYVVQREAMGWYRHDDAIELYAVPGEIQARMGPRPPGL